MNLQELFTTYWAPIALGIGGLGYLLKRRIEKKEKIEDRIEEEKKKIKENYFKEFYAFQILLKQATTSIMYNRISIEEVSEISRLSNSHRIALENIIRIEKDYNKSFYLKAATILEKYSKELAEVNIACQGIIPPKELRDEFLKKISKMYTETSTIHDKILRE